MNLTSLSLSRFPSNHDNRKHEIKRPLVLSSFSNHDNRKHESFLFSPSLQPRKSKNMKSLSLALLIFPTATIKKWNLYICLQRHLRSNSSKASILRESSNPEKSDIAITHCGWPSPEDANCSSQGKLRQSFLQNPLPSGPHWSHNPGQRIERERN